MASAAFLGLAGVAMIAATPLDIFFEVVTRRAVSTNRYPPPACAKQRFAAITAIDFAFSKQNQCCLELQV
jgi:hypothetical protein